MSRETERVRVIPWLIAFILTAPVFGVVNIGYRGLFDPERSTFDVGAFGDLQINTRTGNLVAQRSLFFVPGKGLPVDFVLTYNSDHRQIGSRVGFGWNLSYFIRYIKDSSGNVTILWGDGRQDTFTRSGDAFTPPAGVYMMLKEPNPGQIRLTTKHGIEFRFSNRRLASIADPNGNTLTLSYDRDYRLVSLRDAGGRIYNLGYDKQGLLVTLGDPNLGGRSYALTYDGGRHLVGITDPLSNVEVFTYDADNLITAVTDRRGNRADIAYTVVGGDPNTRLPVMISKGATTSSFAFDRANRRTTYRDPNGNEWKYDYDIAGRIGAVRDPADNGVTYVWDDNKNLLERTDRNGNRARFSYDAAGNPVTVTDALGNRETRSYEPIHNRLTFMIDRNGNGWTLQYDGQGNLTGVITPLNEQTVIANDGMGQAVAITNALGNRTEYGYDGRGNLVEIRNPLGQVSRAVYDGGSRLVGVTDANGNSRSRTYDNLDRLTAATDGLGQSTAFGYDASGSLTSITDRNGNRTTLDYDALYRLVRATDPLDKSQSYTHDGVGHRVSITDRRGNTTRFVYDSQGRMMEKILPLNRSYRFSFDNEGRLVSRLDPKGQTVQFAYDGNNRLVRRTLPGAVATDYAYDGNGNLVAAADPNSSFAMAYDQLNRLISLTDNTLGKTMGLAYDAIGRKVRTMRPEGDVQDYSYDEANRLVRIVADGGNTDFVNDAAGRRTRRTYPNGVKTDYGYDAANRMTSLVTANAGGPLQSFSHQYDPYGNVLREGRIDGQSTMTYDAVNRLTRETRTGGMAYDISSTLDPRGNIVTASGTPFFPTSLQTFRYDAANQIATSTGTGFSGPFNETFTYDDNGNLVRRAGAGTSTVTYAYDALNRIVSVDDSDPAVGREDYTYDALGRLASISIPNPVAGEPGLQRLFYDERGNVMVVYGTGGTVLDQYWHNDEFLSIRERILLDTAYVPIGASEDERMRTLAKNLELLKRIDLAISGAPTINEDKPIAFTSNPDTYLKHKGRSGGAGGGWLGQKDDRHNTLYTDNSGRVIGSSGFSQEWIHLFGDYDEPRYRVRSNSDIESGILEERFALLRNLNNPSGATNPNFTGTGTGYSSDPYIGFRPGAFEVQEPHFGNFDTTTALNVGFANLSDIEAFFFVRAAAERMDPLDRPILAGGLNDDRALFHEVIPRRLVLTRLAERSIIPAW